ncbi:MAG: YbhB/YbcL family Raf kinase inhibitor-like protein, partial [Chlamydiales bacterium]
MQLKSPVFEKGSTIPRKYTCQGIDVSPPLEIADVPAEAKSLALIMDDPDVPESVRKDGMWVHWVVYNIEPSIKGIEEGTQSLGTFGKNTGNQNRYMGPCPPDREHRYFFKLYALDTSLSLGSGATKEELLKAMEGHIIA